jgi:hypothetical protein
MPSWPCPPFEFFFTGFGEAGFAWLSLPSTTTFMGPSSSRAEEWRDARRCWGKAPGDVNPLLHPIAAARMKTERNLVIVCFSFKIVGLTVAFLCVTSDSEFLRQKNVESSEINHIMMTQVNLVL